MKRIVPSTIVLALLVGIILGLTGTSASAAESVRTMRKQVIASATAKIQTLDAIPSSQRFKDLPESFMIGSEQTLPYERLTVTEGIASDKQALRSLIKRAKTHTTLRQLRTDRAYVKSFRVGVVYDTYFDMWDDGVVPILMTATEIDLRPGELVYLNCDQGYEESCAPTAYDEWVSAKWDDYVWGGWDALYHRSDRWFFDLYEDAFNSRWTDKQLARTWAKAHVVKAEFDAFLLSLSQPPYPPSDSDADLVGDAEEIAYGTDPSKLDSDGDGVDDYDELFEYGTDPVDPSDF